MITPEETSELGAVIARKVFKEFGNPDSLPLTEERLAIILRVAFDKYREYWHAVLADEARKPTV